ncbi:MAG: hypothetical protein H0W61_10290 [Bacteroidetes bacterium]|nr:hypothetical protein [Bacteroidota bacterium]
MKKFFLFLSFIGLSYGGFCQEPDSSLHLSAGISFKKFAGFYTMSGVCAEVSGKCLAREHLALGLNVTSSSLGSAFFNNGIPVVAAELYARWIFRKEKTIQPFALLNLGFAKAFVNSDKYSSLSTSALLVSPEAGVACRFKPRMQLQGGLGFNLNSGNGLKGPGFIYPICFQLRLLYTFKN